MQLPLPGSGHTAQRWRRLAELTDIDVVAGRLAEAHADALAILTELDGPAPDEEELWGVWAAEAPDAVVTAHAARVTRLFSTAPRRGARVPGSARMRWSPLDLADGRRGLFAVDLRR